MFKSTSNSYVELDVQFHRPKKSKPPNAIICGFTPFVRINNKNYNFVSASVYFTGNGFPNIISVTLTGNSLSPLNSILTKCLNGSVKVFDQIKVSDKMGNIRQIEGCTYTLTDSLIIREPSLHNN